MTSTRVFRAAAVQAEPAWLDIDAGVQKTIDLIAEAGASDAALVAFPEAWLPGYPYHLWLGTPLWSERYAAGYRKHSVRVGDQHLARIARAAGRHGVAVVLGASELDRADRLFMSQFVFGADGRLKGARRKLHPSGVERSIFSDGTSSDIALHDLPGIGALGALSGSEHLHASTRRLMRELGEDVHVAAWPSFCLHRQLRAPAARSHALAVSRSYAEQAGCFVVAPTTVVGASGLALFGTTDERMNLLGWGGGGCSRIYGPDGSVLSETLPEMDEGLVHAEIDLSLVRGAAATECLAG